ncbi:uncharacterized protein [Diabrotica undecimpunctata]|uniref:uncharacterized protein n=1 Tax=Diabrotica undecimpunctata TaxID=50387 RepID=UPI003B63C36C
MVDCPDRLIPCLSFYSKRSQEYVDDRFDGDNSEVDISDDDDLDADPTWLSEQEATNIGVIDGEEKETISDGTLTTSGSNSTADEDNSPVTQAVSSSKRYFWKKTQILKTMLSSSR